MKEGIAMSNLFFILAIASITCGIVASILIVAFISKRGIKINYLLLRLLIFKYISQYRKITTEENGKPGPWFYPFVTAMILALIFALTGIILKVAVG